MSSNHYKTVLDWITHDSIQFSLTDSKEFEKAASSFLSSIGNSVEILAFGEPLHGGEEFLIIRNLLFKYLVKNHGYTAIAIESSFTHSIAANQFIHANENSSYEGIKEIGFSHKSGYYESNRKLIEWMKKYNSKNKVKVNFYGIDGPTESYFTPSPRQTLFYALDYLELVDSEKASLFHQQVQKNLLPDSDWDNPACLTDSTQSIGLSSSANNLRILIHDLEIEFKINQPDFIQKTCKKAYLLALQHLYIAKQLLNYHAAIAGGQSAGTLLGIRDIIMLENISFIKSLEARIFVFAHNSHLQRSKAIWPWYVFWPLGSHLNEIYGSKFVSIGSGLCVSEVNGIGQPEENSIEANFLSLSSEGHFIPTHRIDKLEIDQIGQVHQRSGSQKNLSYSPLSLQTLKDFDFLAVLSSASYTRGLDPLVEQ
jgi:erythromycin esterase-like protein